MHEWMFDAVSGLHGDLSASEKLEAFSLKTVIETAVDAYECDTIYVAVAVLCRGSLSHTGMTLCSIHRAQQIPHIPLRYIHALNSNPILYE